MRKIFGFLREVWFVALWGCIGIAGIVWIIINGKVASETFGGIPSEPFSIFCAAVTALTGAILGLVLASLVFVLQHSTSTMRTSRETLARENSWLKTWLSGNKLDNEIILQAVENLRVKCLFKPYETLEYSTAEQDELLKTMNDTFEAIGEVPKEYQRRFDVLKKQSRKKVNASDDKTSPNLDEELLHAEEQISLLEDLTSHVAVIFNSLRGIIYAIFSPEIIKQLKLLAIITSIVLMMALIAMIFSGFKLSDVELLTDFDRLKVAIFIVWIFSANIVMIYRVVSLYFHISEQSR